MAHVLLPCDLPIWNDIQRHLAQLKSVKDAKQLILGMTKIYEICNISLEPEDHQNKKPDSEPIFEKFENFLEESLSDDDKKKFFDEILPNLVSQALCLRLAKPQNGFLYSLRGEEEKFKLDRGYVMSMLANGFFSTFPRRTPKTHPSLQNFSFSEFFQHLHRRSQQKKLKAFFRYFDKSEDRKKGSVSFRRKVMNETCLPTLPGWLCSDRVLIPLVIRHEGNIHDAESNVWRAFPCCSLIGGDVLRSATSPESSLFYAFPELLCCLSFIEKLDDNEALVAHNVVPYGIPKKRQNSSAAVTICLMDGMVEFGFDCDKQFEDRSLLRELNKALVAFDQKNSIEDESEELFGESQRRHTPVGESSSSEQLSACSSKKTSAHKEKEETQSEKHYRMHSNFENLHEHDLQGKGLHQNAFQAAYRQSYYIPPFSVKSSEEKPGSRCHTKDSEKGPKLSSDCRKIIGADKLTSSRSHSLTASVSSSKSSTRSMKTASESSVESPHNQQVSSTTRGGIAEDEYYTADEDSDKDASECIAKVRNNHRRGQNLSSLLKSTSSLVEEMPKTNKSATKQNCRLSSSKDSASGELDLSTCDSNSRRSESFGFVLGGTASDEDVDEFDEEEQSGSAQCQPHERLEDFRKRIRRRTRRHLSRKMRSSSRSSYSLGSSTSSDMEDISEENNYYSHGVIRASNSEPSLFTTSDNQDTTAFTFSGGHSPLSPKADTVVVSVGGRKVLITSTNGQLKAYSYDGVSPNLPVPFRAKFRTRRSREEITNNPNNLPESSSWSPLRQELALSQENAAKQKVDVTDRGTSANVVVRLARHISNDFNLRTSISDSDEERSSPKRSSRLHSLSSMDSNQQQTFLRENYADFTETTCYDPKSIIHPMAVGPSKCGNPQLRALILWLAASMSGLPTLIYYTGHESQLHELGAIYQKVLSRQWTVGDLSCEVLRFCRNRLSPRRNSCAASLFDQFFTSGTISIASSISYSQQSLD